jgi:hypothetical protein
MQHALIWSSRKLIMFDGARGWVGSVSFILIFGVMEARLRSHEQPRGLFLGLLELVHWCFFGVLCLRYLAELAS